MRSQIIEQSTITNCIIISDFYATVSDFYATFQQIMISTTDEFLPPPFFFLFLTDVLFTYLGEILTSIIHGLRFSSSMISKPNSSCTQYRLLALDFTILFTEESTLYKTTMKNIFELRKYLSNQNNTL